jgi:hypothetical protein
MKNCISIHLLYSCLERIINFINPKFYINTIAGRSFATLRAGDSNNRTIIRTVTLNYTVENSNSVITLQTVQ